MPGLLGSALTATRSAGRTAGLAIGLPETTGMDEDGEGIVTERGDGCDSGSSVMCTPDCSASRTMGGANTSTAVLSLKSSYGASAAASSLRREVGGALVTAGGGALVTGGGGTLVTAGGGTLCNSVLRSAALRAGLTERTSSPRLLGSLCGTAQPTQSVESLAGAKQSARGFDRNRHGLRIARLHLW